MSTPPPRARYEPPLFSVGDGTLSRVFTDGRQHVFKFFKDDPENTEFEAFARSLAALVRSGVAEDIRPALRAAADGAAPSPCVMAPIYDRSIAACRPSPREVPAIVSFIRATALAMENRGVCYRVFSERNVARCAEGGYALLGIEAATLVSDMPVRRPAFGLYCPFVVHPTEAMPSWWSKMYAYGPEVSIMTMWYAAELLCTRLENGQVPGFPHPRFNGATAVAGRVSAVLLAGARAHAAVEAARRALPVILNE